MFRVTSFSFGVSSLRKTRSVATVMLVAVSRAMACWASPAQLPQVTLRYSSRASSSLPSFFSSVSAIENWACEASFVSGYFETIRRQRRSPRPISPPRTALRFISSRMLGIAVVERILRQELGEQLVGGVVLLGLQLLGGHQVLGVDDLAAARRSTALCGGILHQVVAPRRERLGILLLQLIAAAQQVSGVGNLLAVLVARVGQELLQRGHGVVVAPALDVALRRSPDAPGWPACAWGTAR